jgi:glyceraldehyde 3-phosphate dehydrogenase
VETDSMARIGINGFGRMGRLAFRAAWGLPDLTVVHVNEIKGGPTTAAHLLEFDSVHGRWAREIRSNEEQFTVDGHTVRFTAEATPGSVPWEAGAVDLVLECSGKWLTPETLNPFFDRGVKKVVVAAPVKQGALNIVMGVNDHRYSPNEHRIVTAASCTTTAWHLSSKLSMKASASVTV